MSAAATTRGPASPVPRRDSFADQALEAIRGGTAAQKLVYRLRHEIAGTDELLEAVRGALATGGPAYAEGFCRELQKRLEASR